MGNITYTFDEVCVPLHERTVYISGTIDVEYLICPAEPDVGIFRKYAEINDYGAITYRVLDEDGAYGQPVTLLHHDETGKRNNPDFWVIFEAIKNDVMEACMEDYENGRHYG